jgi:uncharacterized protein (TIGR02001 family)
MKKSAALPAQCALGALVAALSAMPCRAEDPPPFTGHIDLVSKYILRGASTTYGNARPGLGNEGADAPESDKPALQWGVDYVHPSGWYAGYWGSMINYSYKQLGNSYDDRTITEFQKDKSIENDLYGGYTGKIGDFSYTGGLTGYVYYNGKHANALETKLGLGYKEFGVNAQTLLQDTVWGNKGDTYWTATYATTLPYELNFTASLGYYTYKKEGKFLGTKDTALGVGCGPGQAFVVNGCFAGNAPVSGAFRHLIVGVTRGIGKSGVVLGLQGLIPGENRFGVKQAGRVIGSLSYTF